MMASGGAVWWSAAAVAAEPYNVEPEVQVAVVHVFDADHPWGARIAGGMVWSLADHCTWGESDCPGGPIWPLGGALLRADWRGGDRVGAEIVGVLGAGDLDMYQMGYFPLTAAVVVAGPRLAWGAPPGLAVGLQGQRALAIDVAPGAGTTSWRGVEFVAGTIEAGTVLGPAPWDVRLGVGLQGSFVAGSLD
jgi:hypothetical protein